MQLCILTTPNQITTKLQNAKKKKVRTILEQRPEPWRSRSLSDNLIFFFQTVHSNASVRKVGDEQRREHEQVGDRLIDGLGVDHPRRRRRRRALRHGQLHEAGEEEGGEQQQVHLQGGHLITCNYCRIDLTESLMKLS